MPPGISADELYAAMQEQKNKTAKPGPGPVNHHQGIHIPIPLPSSDAVYGFVAGVIFMGVVISILAVKMIVSGG
jgi:tetrahydromethanopterin S-methyltransferase subunit B